MSASAKAGLSEVDAELEGLLANASTSAKGAPRVPPPRQAIAKVGYSHEAMIDLIIANPGISQNMLAATFGYTPSWISQVIASDAFQTALEKRREQIVDPLMRTTIADGFKALVTRSLDILQQKLNVPVEKIPDNLALRALEIGSRAAGYGVKDTSQAAPQTPAEVHIHLEQLGGGLVALLQRKKHEAGAITLQPSQGNSVPGGDPLPLSPPVQQIIDITNDSQED